MVYLTLMVALGVFTCLDALITVIGMGVGCIELNPWLRCGEFSFG